ncbi:MAG: hypothetical protein ACR2OX_04540, partial [Methyloligellaceae bacterium]
GLKVAAAAAYHVDEDDNAGGDTVDIDRFGISAAALHSPSGIHVEGGYSQRETDTLAGVQTTDETHWWIAAGIQFRASELGTSDITIDYIANETDFLTAGVNDVIDYDSFGIGFAQNIDAIGGTMYLSYRHHEADDNLTNVDDDFDQIQFGMRLRY